jgi:UDP-N-acetylmuramoyl-L-alanyl-D-glutamate--2,6-diaminopimelate ligase
MSSAAARGDFVVLTTDNPRSEDPETILDDAEGGLKTSSTPYLRISDRAEAIAAAIHEAESDDVVLLAGKGHETYQDFGDHRIDFDDRRVAAAVLAAL